jgi:hypothetical protein
MEILLIITAILIVTFILMKIINLSIMYIFLFRKKPTLWIIFMFLLSFVLFAIFHILNLKFYTIFWSIIIVSYFQFIKPESEISLIDNIKFAKSTYNEIDPKNGWLKKIAGNLMFIIGSFVGYYLFY